MKKKTEITGRLTPAEMDRVIEMAWEDRTPFEAIKFQFGLSEPEVIAFMQSQLKRSSWKRWRARVHGRATKHAALRDESVGRFRSKMQREINHNRISKR